MKCGDLGMKLEGGWGRNPGSLGAWKRQNNLKKNDIFV
jgi:hypothetical protein